MTARLTTLGTALLLVAAPAFAEEPATLSPGDLTAGAIATEAPAFGLLGVDPTEIKRPETLRQAGVAILNGLDQEGNLQTGFALEIAPILAFSPQSFDADRYMDSPLRQAMSRFKLTMAAAKGTGAGNDAGLRATSGIVWVPIDTGDPYANRALNTCLRGVIDAYENIPSVTETVPTTAGKPETNPILVKSAQVDPNALARNALSENCRIKHNSRSRAFTLQLGLAPLFVSETGNFADLKGRGYTFSAVAAMGLNGVFGVAPTSKFTSQLILGYTYRDKEMIVDPTVAGDDAPLISRNRSSFGAKFTAGQTDYLLVGFELLRQRATYEVLGEDKYTSYAINVDYKLSDDLWITANYGDTSGRNIGKSVQYVGTGLKFSFGNKAK